MNTEKIKEEWHNQGFWIGNSIDKDLVPTEVMEKMADWWLSKLQALLSEKREAMKEAAGYVHVEPNPPNVVSEHKYVPIEKVLAILDGDFTPKRKEWDVPRLIYLWEQRDFAGTKKFIDRLLSPETLPAKEK